MSSLGAIRTAITSAITTAIPTVYGAADVTSLSQLPAVFVEPATGDFVPAMGRGDDEWVFNLFVLVSRRDETSAQAELDSLITGAGSLSIRQALFGVTNILSDTQVVCMGMKGYGGHFKQSGVPMTGAILVLKAFTNGAV
jgi:hypothetical protein